MARFTRMIGRYSSETTAYTAAATNDAGAAAVAAWIPDFTGTLVGVRVMEGGGAATSLMNHVQWKLTCTAWKPERAEVGIDGRGIQTAPAMSPSMVDWPINQPITASLGVTIVARNNNAETPVTVDSFLYGIFESQTLEYIERSSGALTAPTTTNISIEKPQAGRKVRLKLVTACFDTPNYFSRTRAALRRGGANPIAIPAVETVLVAQDFVVGGQCDVDWPDTFTLEIETSVHTDCQVWTLVGYEFE